MKKNYFLAVSLLIAFAGCDNTEIDSIADNEQVAAEVSAGIDGLKTRVTDDSEWQTGDVIGIYGTSGKLTYTACRYNLIEGTNNFEPNSSFSTIYYGAADGEFSAYYPYVEYSKLTNYKTIEGNIIKQQKTNYSPVGVRGQDRIDFLYATAKGTKESPELKFQFAHKMSKLVIRLKAGKGFTTVPFASWYDLTFSSSANNLHSKVIFNPKDGTVTPDGAVDKLAFLYTASPRVSGREVKKDGVIEYVEFVYILCPEESVQGGLKFDLHYDNKNEGTTYTTQLYTDESKTKFETKEGTQYIYTVTVNKTEAKVTDTSINDWNSAVLPDNGEVDANS